MSTDTGGKLRDAFTAHFAPDMASAAVAVMEQQQKVRYQVGHPLDASINTVGNWILDENVQVQFYVQNFKMVVGANVTSNNTSLATISLVTNNGNGGSDTTIATANTATTAGGGTGDLTNGIPYSFTVTAANSLVAAGNQLAVRITKSGAGGLALPNTSYFVKGRLQ
jgi:hypothetical protein